MRAPSIPVACPDCEAPAGFRAGSCDRCGLDFSADTARGAVLGPAGLRRVKLGTTSQSYGGALILTPAALYFLAVERSAGEWVVAYRTTILETEESRVEGARLEDLHRRCLDVRALEMRGSVRIARERVLSVRGVRLEGEPLSSWRRFLGVRDWRGLVVKAIRASGRGRQGYAFELFEPDRVALEEAFSRVWGMRLG